MTAHADVTIGDCRLILGDCREILPTIAGAAAVLTDPPYGIDYQSGHATDALWAGGRRITGDLTTALRDQVLATWAGTSMPQIVFGSRKQPPPPGTRMILIWDKGPALGMGALDLPWKPSYEEIYILGKGYAGKRDEGSVIYCPPVQSMAKNGRLHPNEKPLPLLARLLAKLPKGTVLDPFMGSASTGAACAAVGRSFIGCEVDPQYFDIACRRIEAAYRQPRLFAEPAPKPVQGSLIEAAE